MYKRGQVVVLALLLLAAGCGYRFTVPNASLPAGLSSVRAPLFENRTSDPGAEAVFTEALRQHLHRAGRLGGEAAAGELRGVVVTLSTTPLVASPGRLPNYRLTATVDLQLFKGDAAVGRAQVTGSEEFPAGADVLWTETNRSTALHRLADELTREGLGQLASGW